MVESYVRGDPKVLRIVDRWVDTVLRERFHSIRPDWDDVRQEVRIRVFRNLSRSLFDGRSSLRTYVYRIAANVCIDFSRREWQRREHPFTEELQARLRAKDGDAASELAERDLFAHVLTALRAKDRRLLNLVCAQRRSYAEVAEELGISEVAVRVRVFRLKDRIVKCCREKLGSSRAGGA